MRIHLTRPSPSMIVAVLAIMVTVGGTSYAASKVTSAQIKNNTIKSVDIRNNSVTGADVKNSTLKGTDVKNDSLTGDDVNESTIGKVPSAGSADSATQAVNVGALGGFPAASLIRTAGDAIGGGAVTGATDPTDAATANIATPTNGYVTIRASSDVYNASVDADSDVCWIAIDGTEIRASERVIELNGDQGVNHEENCSPSATVPVSAGVHAVTFVVLALDATTTVFDETALSVMFIPFGNDGTQPTDFSLNP
jgi:hypothetical protein